MSAETLAGYLAWATILQWVVISTLFFWDSLLAHARARRQYSLATEVGNGRVVVAKYRAMISVRYIVGSGLALFLGLLALYSNIFLPHAPPDTRIVGAIIREGIVVMLFAFWRTKRLNVILQRQLDERIEGKLSRTVQDTNERVREIQERGLEDRPEERADREEGHTHREKIDD